MRVNRFLVAVLFLIMFFSVLLLAQDHGLNVTNMNNQKDEVESPSMELLEFLGNWETEGGEWIDPTLLDPTTQSNEEKKDNEEQKDEDS